MKPESDLLLHVLCYLCYLPPEPLLPPLHPDIQDYQAHTAHRDSCQHQTTQRRSYYDANCVSVDIIEYHYL